MTQIERCFVPLDDFWSGFVKLTTANRAPPLEAGAITHFLTTMFGSLTEHKLRLGMPFPAVFDCGACRNNHGARNDAACRTHVGAIRGLFESVTLAPLEVAYEPHTDGSCTVTVERARDPDGRPLVPEARLTRGLVIVPGNAGALIGHDTRPDVWAHVPPVTFAVLSALGHGIQAGPLARRLALAEPLVGAVLGEAWRLGWVECRFTPEEATT